MDSFFFTVLFDNLFIHEVVLSLTVGAIEDLELTVVPVHKNHMVFEGHCGQFFDRLLGTMVTPFYERVDLTCSTASVPAPMFVVSLRSMVLLKSLLRRS